MDETTGFTYTYGVRRASRPDVFRTQFGSLSAEEYITPLVQRSNNFDGNVARRLSRNSFLIPRQTLVRRPTDDLKDRREQSGYCFHVLIILSYVLVVITFPLSLCFCMKVVQEYERAVIFRLGRILANGARGPGLFFILPCIDTYSKVDLRTVTFDVPPQEILTKDSVTVAVDAVVYFRIFNAVISITNVEDAAKSTKLLAATTLRNVLGTKTLQEILAERDKIDTVIQTSLDEATDPWGVKVERVEVKDVRLPVALQKAMAAEAEASRDARAKIIAAEGEMKASRGLKEAGDIINESPIAMQLRYLQTLTQIATERNSTIVFPIPVELLQALSRHRR
ncbi:unnamed protein product [Didymodactylos carnosus]|uniref:Band 7 domain-containing protein n=1 Tax=Didymodactylos carnosus TaxID=1234261 RepID=A0A813QS56_9BILA|nr:unnamed protein product [Didymodactylos carnosus]CAF0782912.1 unnamed protein product [Didymodactylos carnosus]CAF3553173.1 unnamed protein product [Didymodactylos carnosus]CAF3564718.1 unnamed protein product [Didymodactylos carnosus]